MKIAFLGDIAFFGAYNIIFNHQLIGRQSVTLMGGVKSYLSNFDLVVGNLETPFSYQKKKYGAKSAYLYSEPVNVEMLKELNVGVVNLANNHMFDFGEEGYETTKRILSQNGIGYFGTEGKSWIYEKDGNKLMFSGFCCYSTNPLRLAEKQGGYGINKFNVADIKSQMKSADGKGYFNIISAHVGLEHVNYPSIDHIRAARQFAKVCPYFYYGHHPHVIQGVEEYEGSLIAHSLGNFCFDDIYTDASGDMPLIKLSEQNRKGLIMELTMENNRIISWKEQMIYCEPSGTIKLIYDDEKLTTYNEAIVHSENDVGQYIEERQKFLNARIADRKSKRDLSWVLKRLRPWYIRLFFDMKQNKKGYSNNVMKYL